MYIYHCINKNKQAVSNPMRQPVYVYNNTLYLHNTNKQQQHTTTPQYNKHNTTSTTQQAQHLIHSTTPPYITQSPTQ